MDPDSTQVTLGRLPTLYPAQLSGYRPAWNVAAQIREGNNLGRVALYADGSQYDGLIVPIGLESGAEHETIGMLFEVTVTELTLLDMRELNYDRVDVTEDVRWLQGAPVTDNFTAYVYVPKVASVRRLREAVDAGVQVAVVKSYLDILERAVQNFDFELKPNIPAPDWHVHDVRFDSSSTSTT